MGCAGRRGDSRAVLNVRAVQDFNGRLSHVFSHQDTPGCTDEELARLQHLISDV